MLVPGRQERPSWPDSYRASKSDHDRLEALSRLARNRAGDPGKKATACRLAKAREVWIGERRRHFPRALRPSEGAWSGGSTKFTRPRRRGDRIARISVHTRCCICSRQKVAQSFRRFRGSRQLHPDNGRSRPSDDQIFSVRDGLAIRLASYALMRAIASPLPHKSIKRLRSSCNP